MHPLDQLCVVEIAGSVAGAYCAKMFADGGATVLRVGEATLTAHQHLYLDEHKTTTTLDEIDLASVDVVIQSSAPRPLQARTFPGDQIVHVHLSPFGSTGERAGWQGTDLTDYAVSGHAHLYGDPDRAPLQGPANQPAVAAGLYGFIGAMAALLARGRLGRGQTVDVSHVQVMVALHQVTLLRWQMSGSLLGRMGNRYTGQGQPNGPYRCRDGWVSIVGVTDPQVESILAATGLLHLLDHPKINSVMDFLLHPELMDEPLNRWLSEHTVAEVVELFQAMRVPACPLLDPIELLDDPQLVARDFFRSHSDDPTISVPGLPFSFHPSPVPSNAEVAAWEPGPIADGPLAGLQILDMARVWAGPLCAQILGNLGADVVWVEAPWHRGPQQVPPSFVQATAGEQPWNRNTHFVKYSLGKQSLAIDLQTTEGQAAFARLVPQFHVLLENFSTRVMPQLGFDEAHLHELNPNLVYLTMPGYGRSGPAEHWLAYGSCIDSHAGLSSLIGYADVSPWKGGIAWPDPIAGLHAASATLSALWASQTGRQAGVTVEAAQFESTIAAIGDRVVEAQIDGTFIPKGNRHPSYLAQGVYRCTGDDEWIAISMPDLESWKALCDLTGVDESLAHDHDALDHALSEFTSGQHAAELADSLQAIGVPAAKAAKAPDLHADPHLASIGNWVTLDQPQIGDFIAGVSPINLSATPVRQPTAAPTMGQHNHDVLRGAGFSAAEVAQLEATATITDHPPN